MKSGVLILFFGLLLTANCQTCDCVPIGNSIFDQFKSPITNNVCSDGQISMNTTCISTNFDFGNILANFGTVILSNDIQITAQCWISIMFLNLGTNYIIRSDGYLHCQHFKIENNALLLINDSFSIAKEMEIINPKIGEPKVVMWNINRLHLYKNSFDFDIINPIGNEHCFDIFSMNNASCLNFDISETSHLTPGDFPRPLKEGTASLLSNGRLLRFCPTDTQKDNIVTCTLNDFLYKTEYNGTAESYPFEYPHCPCDDLKTTCYLQLNQTLNAFDFNNISMTSTTLVISKSVQIYNANEIKEIQIEDDVKLNISKLYKQTFLSFSFGEIGVKNTSEQDIYVITYTSLIHTLSISNRIQFDLDINEDIKEIRIDAIGQVNTLTLNGDSFISLGKNIEKLNQVNLTSNFTEENSAIIYIENSSSVNGILPNCILMKTLQTKNVCLKCILEFILDNGICIEDANCISINSNNRCIQCEDHYHLNDNNTCVLNEIGCLKWTKNECIQCDNDYILNIKQCIKNSNCSLTNGVNCIKCLNGELANNCETCKDVNCLSCVYNKCQTCQKNFYLAKDGVCHQVENGSFEIGNSILYCDDHFYIDNLVCKKCTEKDPTWSKCVTNKPTKCVSSYYMSDIGTCESTTCINEDVIEENGQCVNNITDCVFISNKKCVECDDDFIINSDFKCSTSDVTTNKTHCIQSTKYGCIKCTSNYYLINNECKECDSSCETCVTNSTFCLSCPEGTFLNDHKCITNEELIGICTQFIPTGGCVKCKDKYFRNGLSCTNCDTSCGLCNTIETCLTCNITNYRTINNKCQPQSSIINCAVKVTQKGCSKCEDGFYIVNTNECERCSESCATCVISRDMCTSCNTNEVLIHSKCLSFASIKNCKMAKNSKCSKCNFWHIPSENGTYCISKAVWWVILILAIFVIIIVTLILVATSYILKKVLKTRHTKKMEKDTTVFQMSKSNIQFIAMGNGVVVNKTEIVFNSGDEISVNEKVRELFCVGNTSKHNMKVQISTQHNENMKYEILSNPLTIILKKGFACEFEVFLTLLCTSKIESAFVLVTNAFDQQTAFCKEIKISARSKLSTRLDPDDLKEEKKIGEGSFGVVFKGSYRGNVVVIKKMKNTQESLTEEFTKEVEMLDKFRSEYIVHFYGAVFIPSKFCEVTEFAQFGSLQDLMKHKKSEEVDIKIRVKMMIDGAKGILYLHNNGILHRDIKPDNILVFSLDLNNKVNTKLTDFGASRNVNLLMTNMTFTKGIGTPKYMAPEVLNQEKYKKEADVYSFAITMYECFGWKEAFPKNIYKFAWDIADSIAIGKRPKLDVFNEQQKLIIEKAWKHDPKQRSDISDIIKSLESMHF
ncbi:protein serine/threonine kinase, putative [Entamoeba invadens IP1]|uniref:Protein serine/threonine kinase, putative n=1 Tax=Entamoeba invadens IP1 TaxID=370355 RepID=A0A0A1TYH3_ENTIV|nr:protein serine/threonine kinase, putative [Entamoeba invadens IP1]ELP83546.1 protein serine/threonine kinase, putative [Entamoeba invadens IP1]|eukprot:XP_004182892.1 protein serine/threonine kinase, putative [Entamoeba invadens IP1]